jgi:malate dehydrogenase (oxaloacetate-decarboxylating)
VFRLSVGDKKVRILRASLRDQPGYLGKLTQLIGEIGANIGDIYKVRTSGASILREIEIYIDDERQVEALLRAAKPVEGLRIDDVFDPVLELHRGGKIRMRSQVPIQRIGDLRKIYTPGVATVCREIQANPERVYDYTSLGHSVAIVTNGTAVLGLGNIGVHPALPVMEGKSALLDRLIGLSGIPILIPTRDVQTFVDTVIQIAPSFGAIQLEDVAAPECFEIERALDQALPIPVVHDDQHGTAIVVLAALLSAGRLLSTDLARQSVGIIGLGAAGLGIARLLAAHGVKELMGTDVKAGAMERLRNLGGTAGGLDDVLAHADVVVACSGRPRLIDPARVRAGQVILALSNPDPEIDAGAARAAGAAIAADGRSVNNALAFPGLLRGALDARVSSISDAMKIAAARALAEYAEQGELVPDILDTDVHQAVAEAVEDAARGDAA